MFKKIALVMALVLYVASSSVFAHPGGHRGEGGLRGRERHPSQAVAERPHERREQKLSLIGALIDTVIISVVKQEERRLFPSHRSYRRWQAWHHRARHHHHYHSRYHRHFSSDDYR